MLIPNDSFSAEEIAALAAQQAAQLTDTFTILRLAVVPDGAGGVDESFSSVGTVNGALTTMTHPAEAVKGGRLQAETYWKAILPLGTPVYSRDRLEVNGEQFEVVDTDRGKSQATVLTAYLQRINER